MPLIVVAVAGSGAMGHVRKVMEEDGTFSVLGAGGVVRSSLTAEEADDVMAMLAPMDSDD